KGQSAETPVQDETKQGRGLRLRPEKSVELAPVKTRGATGAIVELSVAKPSASFAAGIKFDASTKDAKSRRLVIRDTGEVALYEMDGPKEKRIAFATLGKKLAAGQWIELGFVAEGGDLVCFVAERPMFLIAATVPTDRDVAIWTS